MIKKAISYQLSALSILLLFFTMSYAQPICSTELINNAKEYDGKIVSYAGEVIGDIMVRQEFAWINVNDGKAAIGVWAAQDLIREIEFTGSYKTKGDWVEITGVFHRACLEHGADLDIHAQSIRRIRPGRQMNRPLNPGKINLTIVLFGVLGLIWILRQLK